MSNPDKKILSTARPGDLLIIKSPGRLIDFGRSLVRSEYDHIAVVNKNLDTVNIVFPKTRIIPLEKIADLSRVPVLLRPVWKGTEETEFFLDHFNSYLDADYNVLKTIKGFLTLILYNWTGVTIKLDKLEESNPEWICTEAILISLIKSKEEYISIEELGLDYNKLGFATINDFLRIAESRPDLLQHL